MTSVDRLRLYVQNVLHPIEAFQLWRRYRQILRRKLYDARVEDQKERP